MYMDWVKNKEHILKIKPDIVLLSNSRLGFISRDIKKSDRDIKIITQFDNIEKDYCKNYMDKFSGIKKYLYSPIESLCVSRDEKDSITYSDKLLFLTERDKKRAAEIYKTDLKGDILPICVDTKKLVFKRNDKRINLVFLASLWYEPNSSGILWFIENVWQKLKNTDEMSIIIGGKRPPQKLMDYNGKNNIFVFPDYNKVEDIVPENSIFISPLFSGAGMKVKVAEALSFGFPIIASEESLAGYEMAVNDKSNYSIFPADTESEFINRIEKIICDDKNYRENALSLYKKYYSIDNARMILERVINDLYKNT
jgi:glycosyltransferase involved in cell wall biosynthesis